MAYLSERLFLARIAKNILYTNDLEKIKLMYELHEKYRRRYGHRSQDFREKTLSIL